MHSDGPADFLMTSRPLLPPIGQWRSSLHEPHPQVAVEGATKKMPPTAVASAKVMKAASKAPNASGGGHRCRRLGRGIGSAGFFANIQQSPSLNKKFEGIKKNAFKFSWW